MTRAYFSARLDADIGTTWAVVGDFHAVADWVSGIELRPSWRIRPAPSRRHQEFTTSRGATLQEAVGGLRRPRPQLLVRIRRYNPVSGEQLSRHRTPLPIIEDGTTFIEWFGDFDSEPDVRADVKRRFEKLYTVFIGDLRRRLAIP